MAATGSDPQTAAKQRPALKRPTGATLERKATPKRTPLKKQSKARAREMAIYHQEKNEWLLRPENAACAICLCLGVTPKAATEVHHKNGRIGRLLRYQPWWIPSCRSCRDVPHDRPNWARDMGILGEKNQWNVFPSR